MFKGLFYIVFSFLIIAVPSIARAQLEDTTEMGNVVVSVGNIRPTTTTNTVHNVRIISAKTIERQGAFNLKDVLIKENNIRIGNDNILGSSLSLQGISGQNVKVLIDGIPITGRENGNIDLGQINLNNIERIEIIEGPLSVIYGTDALGGVINLVSKRITLDSSKPAIAYGNAYIESTKQYNFGAGGIVKLKDIDFGASINRNFFGGYSMEPNSRVMFWKPKQQVFGNFSITKQTGKLKIKFNTSLFNEKIENRGSPIINHLEAYAYDEYYLTNRNINSLNIEHKINKRSYWNVLTAFSFYLRDKVTYRKDLTNSKLEIVPSPDANSSNSFLNFMSRGSYSNAVKPYFSYQLGYDINMNSALGTKIETDRGRMNDYAVFACAEIKPFRKFSIKPGFRATYNTRYSAPFVPSIQFMLKSIKNVTLRYSYGRGFRAPGLKELYLHFVDYNHNIIGNPNLQSEMSDNHNAAIKYKINVNKKLVLYLDNSYFYNQIFNQIALVSTNPIKLEYTYENIDNFKSIGANFNFTALYKNFRATLGGSYTGIYNNAFEMVGKDKYLYSPELRAQATYIFKKGQLKDLSVSMFHKYNGSTIGYALNNVRKIVTTTSESYNILDFTLSKPFLAKKINLTAGVKNVMNITTIRATNISTNFHNAGSSTMPVSVGRSIFAQININI
ncbi:MAG: TonB-dependent receptor [Bacteroidia bacterium]